MSATAQISTINCSAPRIHTITQLVGFVGEEITAGRKDAALQTLSQLQDATHQLETQIHNMKDMDHEY